jgi:hypothetical protein
MGRGKTSVIVPIIATALANKSQLVRVIVLRPLAMQMFQLLVSKLGGMLNRRILYLPVSRSLDVSVNQTLDIRRLYEECQRSGSILLLQPEHILSFELMALEGMLSGDAKLGRALTDTQKWLYDNTRDILDESDEILSVRFELIYTIGMQRAIDFSPSRWTIMQHIFGLLQAVANEVLQQFPHGLEVLHHDTNPRGRYPRIRILQPQAGEYLLKIMAKKVCEQGVPGLSVQNLPALHKETLFKLLTDRKMNLTDAQAFLEFSSSSDSLLSGLLLLKGLFTDGVLRFALEQKRWRVNFGLDPSRTMLAVPYHAKDSPAARAEFSHPDATIALTCLSYYYGGLTHEQIRASFEALSKSDQAQEKYQLWVEGAPDLPVSFHQVEGVNLKDSGQCSRDVFPPLRYSKGIIDFYMSNIVFPAQMKEFPNKLSSSGWDIARDKAHPTTGFSGTNDSRYVLPLTIKQTDLPAQISTNAYVMDCLLQPENCYADVQESSGVTLNAQSLLKIAVTLKPSARVILDVGAQVLEQNEDVAREWLERVPVSEAQAVVFFNSGNEICVLSRDGIIESLLVSPFARQMDQCLVYLDESHTRGTDLKLPADYRAIVTLGPGLTKDRLVQACMRMRKLGKGQSVVFCSSMEIQRKILQYSVKQAGDTSSIEVADVLKWCIAETCASTKKSIPNWATQGLRHQHRRAVCSDSAVAVSDVHKILEAEAQTLKQRYGIRDQNHQVMDQISRIATCQAITSRPEEVRNIREKCQEFEVVSFDNATLLEEQERELSPENEREQQVELPPQIKPLGHVIHSDVRALARTGTIQATSTAFIRGFDVFIKTSAGKFYDGNAWPHDLIVTKDFANTIPSGKQDGELGDFFLRPVRWILSFKDKGALQFVVLSPYEAHELLPDIRRYKKVTLHIYSVSYHLRKRFFIIFARQHIPPPSFIAYPQNWIIR